MGIGIGTEGEIGGDLGGATRAGGEGGGDIMGTGVTKGKGWGGHLGIAVALLRDCYPQHCTTRIPSRVGGSHRTSQTVGVHVVLAFVHGKRERCSR